MQVEKKIDSVRGTETLKNSPTERNHEGIENEEKINERK